MKRVIVAHVSDPSSLGCGGPSSDRRPPAADRGSRCADERTYLLERVDDAAVVQLYADGFDGLPLKEKTLIWHLYQAALAGRDIFYDQRYAHNLEMRDVLEAIVDALRPAIDPTTLAEIQRYTKLFWINTGPYNNLTARKFVLKCTPDGVRGRGARRREGGRHVPAPERRDARSAARRGSQPMFFDPSVDPMVTAKTPPPGKDILTASANNLYVGVTMKDLEGFDERYPLNSRLVKQDGKLVEEVYRVDGRYGGQIAAIVQHLEAAIPFATEPMADGAPRAHHVLPDGRDRRPRGLRHRLGRRTRPRRSTRSTASSRSTSTRAASRARGKGSCSTSTARRRRRSRSWRATRSGSRTGCRGIRSTGSRACRASPPTPSTSSSRPATPVRSRRSASTCRTIRRSASGTAASRCRCRTSTRPTTSRRCRRSAASSPGRPRKPSARRSGARSPAS